MKLSKDIGREELIEKQGDSEFQTFFKFIIIVYIGLYKPHFE